MTAFCRKGTYMSTDFIIKIRKNYRLLRPSERKVADEIIRGDFDPAELTIERLSEAAGVSQPTVIRFARAMGLSGFREIKTNLIRESLMAEETGGVSDILNFDISADDKFVDIPMKVINASIRQMEDTLKNLSVFELMKASELIGKSRQVLILAAENSSTVAEDMASKLIYLGINAVYYQDLYRQSMAAASLTEDDTAIGISYTGCSACTVKALGRAEAAGAGTVALTNFENAPINRHADIILCTGNQQHIYSNALYSRCGQLAVVDMIYYGILLSDYEGYSARIREKSRISDGISMENSKYL